MLSDFERNIQAMWKQGKTMTEIAVSMDVTRNVISGQIYRMRARGVDMEKRVEPINRTHGGTIVIVRRPKPVNPTPRAPKEAPLLDWINRLFTEKKSKPLPKPKEAAMAKPLNVRFKNLTAHSCRYVLNDGPAESFIFCGAPKERGPYCEAHASICYVVPIKSAGQQKHNPNAQQTRYKLMPHR